MRFCTVQVFFILVLLALKVRAQSYESVYNQALVMIEQNRLEEAEALLTTLIKTRSNSLVLYNRGLVRQALGNECGYCEDMREVYRGYTDDLALKNIQKECTISSDTILKSKKFVTVPEGSNHRYQVVELQYKCTDRISGQIIDTEQTYTRYHIPGNYLSINNVMSMTMPKTNMFARFFYEDDQKVYLGFAGMNRPTIKRHKSNWGDQLDIIALTLANRYPEISELSPYLLVNVILDESGKVFKVSNSLEPLLSKEINDAVNDLMRDKFLEFFDTSINSLFKERVWTQHSWMLEF